MILAQRLNFTQAAADLFIALPALSRTISALERELEVRLFERTPRSVSLTPAGRAFFKSCPAILDNYRSGVSAAHLAQKGFTGSLTLGIMRDNFESTLPEIFQAFHREYPQISLYLRGYSHSKLLSAFERGEVDAILNYQNISTVEDDEEMILLRRNRQCVIMSLDHPFAGRGSLRVDELRNEPFVVMARTVSIPGHDFIWRTAMEAGFAPHVVEEAAQVPVLLTLVACGIGISTLGDDMEYLARGQVAFVPLLGVPLSNQVFMWHRSSTNPALPHLVETIRSLQKNGGK